MGNTVGQLIDQAEVQNVFYRYTILLRNQLKVSVMLPKNKYLEGVVPPV